MVAPSRRPWILGYLTGDRPVVGEGDSITGDKLESRPISGSTGESSSYGPEYEVSIVVAEPLESFEPFRSILFRLTLSAVPVPAPVPTDPDGRVVSERPATVLLCE